MGFPSVITSAPESEAPVACSTYHLGDVPAEVDSAMMAEYTDRTFALMADDLASWEYHDKATKPTVARIANTVITTMSSARVNPAKTFLRKTMRMNRQGEISGLPYSILPTE